MKRVNKTVAPVTQIVLEDSYEMLPETTLENNCTKQDLITALAGIGLTLTQKQKTNITADNSKYLRYIFSKIPFDSNILELGQALPNFTSLVSQGLSYWSSFIPSNFQPGVLPKEATSKQYLFAIIYDPSLSKSEIETKINNAFTGEIKALDDDHSQESIDIHSDLYKYAIKHLTAANDQEQNSESKLQEDDFPHKRELIQLLLTAEKAGIKINAKDLKKIQQSLPALPEHILSNQENYNYENNLSLLRYLMVEKKQPQRDGLFSGRKKRYAVECSTNSETSTSTAKLTILKKTKPEGKQQPKESKVLPGPIPCSVIPEQFLVSEVAKNLFAKFPYELSMLFGIGCGDLLEQFIKNPQYEYKIHNICEFLRKNKIYQIYETSEHITLSAFIAKMKIMLSSADSDLLNALSSFMPPEQFFIHQSENTLVPPVFTHLLKGGLAFKDDVLNGKRNNFFEPYLDGVLQDILDFSIGTEITGSLSQKVSIENYSEQAEISSKTPGLLEEKTEESSILEQKTEESPICFEEPAQVDPKEESKGSDIKLMTNAGSFKEVKELIKTCLVDKKIHDEVIQLWDPRRIETAVDSLFNLVNKNQFKMIISAFKNNIDLFSYINGNKEIKAQIKSFLKSLVCFVNQITVLNYLQSKLRTEDLKKIKAHGVLIDGSVLAEYMKNTRSQSSVSKEDDLGDFLFSKARFEELQGALLAIADFKAFNLAAATLIRKFLTIIGKPYGAEAIYWAWSLNSASSDTVLSKEQKAKPMVAGFIYYLESLFPNIQSFGNQVTSIEYFQKLEALLLFVHNPKIGLDKINALKIDEDNLNRLLNLAIQYKQSCIEGLLQDKWFESCVSDLKSRKYYDFDVKLQLIIQKKENKDFNNGIVKLLSNPIILFAFKAGDAEFITENISEVLLHASKADPADLIVYLYCKGDKKKLKIIEDLKASEGGGLLYEYLLKKIRSTRSPDYESQSEYFRSPDDESKSEDFGEQGQESQPIEITQKLKYDLEQRLNQEIEGNVDATPAQVIEDLYNKDDLKQRSNQAIEGNVDATTAQVIKDLANVESEIKKLRKNNSFFGFLHRSVKNVQKAIANNTSSSSLENNFQEIKKGAATIAETAYKKYVKSIKVDYGLGLSADNKNSKDKYLEIRSNFNKWTLDPNRENKSKGELLGLLMALNHFVSLERKILRKHQFIAICLQLAGLETARMETGSGKTLVFTFTAIVNAKLGKQVFLSTINESNFKQAIDGKIFLFHAASVHFTAIRPGCLNPSSDSPVMIGNYKDIKFHILINHNSYKPNSYMFFEDEYDAPQTQLGLEVVKEFPFRLSDQQWTEFFKAALKVKNKKQMESLLEGFRKQFDSENHEAAFQSFQYSFKWSLEKFKQCHFYYEIYGNQVKPLGPCCEWIGVFPGMIKQFIQASKGLVVTSPKMLVLREQPVQGYSRFGLSATSAATKKPVNLTKGSHKKRKPPSTSTIKASDNYSLEALIEQVAEEVEKNHSDYSTLVVVLDKEDAGLLETELFKKGIKVETYTGAAEVIKPLDTSKASKNGEISIVTMDLIRSLDLKPPSLKVVVCANKGLFRKKLPALFEQIEGRKRSNVPGYVKWMTSTNKKRLQKQESFISWHLKISKALNKTDKLRSAADKSNEDNAKLTTQIFKLDSEIKALDAKIAFLTSAVEKIEANKRNIEISNKSADSNKGWFRYLGGKVLAISGKLGDVLVGSVDDEKNVEKQGQTDLEQSNKQIEEFNGQIEEFNGQIEALKKEVTIKRRERSIVYGGIGPLNNSQGAQKGNKKWWMLGTLIAFVAAGLVVYFTHSFNVIKSGIGKAWQWLQANTFKAVCTIVITLVLIAIVVAVRTNSKWAGDERVSEKRFRKEEASAAFEILVPMNSMKKVTTIG